MKKIPMVLLKTVLFMWAFAVPIDAAKPGEIIRSYDKNGIDYTEWEEENGYRWIKTWDLKNKRRGAQTLSGATIIPLSRNYSNVFFHPETEHPDGGYFEVHKKGYSYSGIVDIHGREIIAPNKYNQVSFHPATEHPDGGYFGVCKNGYSGIADIHGREIIAPNKYDFIMWFDGEYRGTRPNSKQYETIAYSSTNSKNNVPATTPSNSYASTSSNSENPTYHYTKSGRGQSMTTGQWTDGFGSEECEVTFDDNYITVNGACHFYVRTSGKWKVYGGVSMGWGGSSTTFYYYVDDYKNMQQVCESVMPYATDTFVYPMSRNGNPTPQIVNSSSYGNSSLQESSGSNSDNHNSRPSYNNGGYHECHICHGSGVCPTCNGRGYITNYGNKSDCPNCYLQNMRSTGKCSRCQGRGKIFK